MTRAGLQRALAVLAFLDALRQCWREHQTRRLKREHAALLTEKRVWA